MTVLQLMSLVAAALPTLATLLQGFASMQQASRSTSDKQDPVAEEAVSNLFQAANVFKAANQAAHYGQQAHVAASCDMIKRVINNLLVNLTGSYSKPAAGVSYCRQQHAWKQCQLSKCFCTTINKAECQQIRLQVCDWHAWSAYRHALGLETSLFALVI